MASALFHRNHARILAHHTRASRKFAYRRRKRLEPWLQLVPVGVLVVGIMLIAWIS